jgi:hypothetical protein
MRTEAEPEHSHPPKSPQSQDEGSSSSVEGGAPAGDEKYDLEGSIPDVSLRGYDPEPGRDMVRGLLAVAMVGLLSGIILASFILLAIHQPTTTDVKDLLGIILPPVVALAGTVLGFYFGGKGQGSR